MSEKYEKAIDVARVHHRGQLRKDGTPYINHPLNVAKTLEKYGFPEEALICAILHDVVEDSSISNLKINEIFGTRVGFTINALSKNQKPKNNKQLKEDYEKKLNQKKISNLENYENFEEYIDYRFHLYINRLYNGIIAEPWVFFIKVADQLDNLSDMSAFRPDKRLRKIEEVETYFLPLYYRCENLFKFDPKYQELYKEFISLLEEKINKAKINI